MDKKEKKQLCLKFIFLAFTECIGRKSNLRFKSIVADYAGVRYKESLTEYEALIGMTLRDILNKII